ncbi:oligosaccharide flippase family protein [Parvibaculum sp.]|uniref:oligosaccharide flippase family protein n=1 Tax=Parvibaculum sp. TaxID=2024848 RepID=UPI003297AA31
MSKPTKGMFHSLGYMLAAHLTNSIISLVRMKLLALLVGPSGIGILGLLQSIQSTSTSLAGLGIVTSSVRQVAQTQSDPQVFPLIKSALFFGVLLQGVAAMIAVWVFSEPLAKWFFNDPGYGHQVGLLAIAILLTMIGSSQVALLQGFRKVKDLSLIIAITALASTAVGLLVISWIGEEGIIWFLLAQAVINIIVAHVFVRKIEIRTSTKTSFPMLLERWMQMARLGIPFMLGALVTAATLLAVRSIIVDKAGLDAAGYFSASWSISLLVLNFILQAMHTDFYPRLSSNGTDKKQTAELISGQILVNLSAGGPIILFVILSAPFLVTLLFSESFAPTVELLQWLCVGNVMKLVSLPLSYVLAARGQSVLFFIAEALWNGLFIVIILLGYDQLDLTIVGISYCTAYAFFFIAHIVYLQIFLNLRAASDALQISAIMIGVSIIVFALSNGYGAYGIGFGALIAIVASVLALRAVVARTMRSSTAVPTLILRVCKIIGLPLRDPEASSNTK